MPPSPNTVGAPYQPARTHVRSTWPLITRDTDATRATRRIGRDALELRPVLFVLQGPQQGAVFRLDRSEMVVGRGESADIRLMDDGISRAHARLTLERDEVFVEDLHSRNGTFVYDTTVTGRTRLDDGDYLRLGNNTVVKFARIAALEERALRELFDSTLRDPLTRIANRRYFDERFFSEFSFAQRHRSPLALLLIDIDHFKHVNDTLGHQAGDVVLKIVAATLQKMMRPEDVVARYGGEEFIVIGRGLSLRNAIILGERIRRRVEEVRAPLPEGEANVTVSVGVAHMGSDRPCASANDLISLADQALYAAKEAGRNQVRTAPDGN